MGSFFRLALGLLTLLVGLRLWAMVSGRRPTGACYLTGARQVRLLFWPLAGLVASLPFVLGVTQRAGELPWWGLAAVGLIGAALLSLSLPALLLHARYQRHDGQTVVLFRPREALLEVRRPDRPFLRIWPDALASVTWTRTRWTQSFGAAYEALRLEFHDNTPPLLLTSIVLDLPPVVAWLRERGVAVKERTRFA